MLVFAFSLFNLLLRWVEKVGKFDLFFCFQVLQHFVFFLLLLLMNFKIMYFLMKILGNMCPSADSAASRVHSSAFFSKWEHEVLKFFSPPFIDDTLNTRAECVRDSLICRKYMFLAKIFALRSMGIQLVPSPIESKLNDCLRNLAYIIKIQQSLDQNIFYLNQRVLGKVYIHTGISTELEHTQI